MEEEVIKKAQKGDPKAFEEIITYYQKDLYKIARTRLNQEDDICDAIQETILSAYKSVHKLHNVSKLKAWLVKILINKCNDIYKNKRINNVSYEEIKNEKYSTEINSNLEFDNLISKLSADERTILVLYYSEKYTTKEISKILKINENTVRSKISRAKTKIENDMKGGQ